MAESLELTDDPVEGEPDQIAKNIRSYTALFAQLGHKPAELIKHLAETHAWMTAKLKKRGEDLQLVFVDNQEQLSLLKRAVGVLGLWKPDLQADIADRIRRYLNDPNDPPDIPF